MHELADLFIVEYLKKRPDMKELIIPRGAEMLQESLERYRQRSQDDDSEPDEPDGQT